MTKKTGPFRLSACMMVKDEEINLSRCLQSIKSFVDEIIVVDTGSSDRTVQIAESFGASVYHHAWADDFSLHRNQSLSYATGNWVLIIDADEELIFGKDGITHVRETLKNSKDKNGFALILKNIQSGRVTSQNIHPRFFRKGHISYTGIVHNQPVFKGTVELLPESDIHLRHYGYDYKNIVKKSERSIPLLEKQLEENPNNWQVYYYLCQIYGYLRDLEKSIEMGQIYIDHKDDLNAYGHKNFQESIYTSLLSSFMELGKVEETIELFNRAVKEAPEDLDIARNEVELGVWLENPVIVLHGTYRFLDLYMKYQKDFRMAKNHFIHSFSPDALSYCLRQCVEICTQFFLTVVEKADPQVSSGMIQDHKKFLKEQGLT